MQTVDQIYRRNKKKKVWKFLMTMSNIASIRIKKEVFEAEEQKNKEELTIDDMI